MNEKLMKLCYTYGFNGPEEVKEIIRRAFSHNPFTAQPKVFILIKALNVAKAFLKTDTLYDVVRWSKMK